MTREEACTIIKGWRTEIIAELTRQNISKRRQAWMVRDWMFLRFKQATDAGGRDAEAVKEYFREPENAKPYIVYQLVSRRFRNKSKRRFAWGVMRLAPNFTIPTDQQEWLAIDGPYESDQEAGKAIMKKWAEQTEFLGDDEDEDDDAGDGPPENQPQPPTPVGISHQP